MRGVPARAEAYREGTAHVPIFFALFPWQESSFSLFVLNQIAKFKLFFHLTFFLLDILRFFDTRREKKNLQVIFACRMKGGKQAAIINLSIYRRKRHAWRTPACATHFEMLSACGRKQPLRGCGASSQEQLVAPLQRMLECFLLA